LPPTNTPALIESVSPSFSKDFTCLARLGRGAFGEVFHCRDHADGKEYAVKAVRFKSGRKDAEIHARREVDMLAAVNHLNIMRYHRHWIEFDRDRCANDADVGVDVQTPMSPKVDFLPKLVELSTEISCNYDGCSCEYSGVIFEGTHDDDPHLEAETSAPFGAVLGEKPLEGTEFIRRISSGKAPSHDICQSASECIGQPCDEMATLYIQVELCRKETLQDWINNRNAKLGTRDDEQTAREAINLFYQCTCALAHLHDRSLVHRDVKPSNIFFSQDGSVRLGDFGLAKAVDRELESGSASKKSPQGCSSEARQDSDTSKGQREKKHGCAVGTPSYASPEQRRGDVVDVSTDVYSLGLVLMELICPVKTQMERAVILQRLRESREVPSTKYLRTKCQRLARLALWMTEPEPSQRPTAKEIISFTRSVRRRHPTCGNANLTGASVSSLGKTCKMTGSTAVAQRSPTTSGTSHRNSRWLRRRCLHRSSQNARPMQNREPGDAQQY
jgi:serine/threonine protein kinase